MPGVGEEKGYIRLVNARGETIGMTKEWQIPPDATDYVIFRYGDKIKAKNGRTGEVEFKDSDFYTVFQNVINTAQAGSTVFIAPGYYELSNTITITKWLHIIGAGRENGVTIKYTGTGTEVFKFDATERHLAFMRFENLKIDANGATGIKIEAENPYAFNHNIFKNLLIDNAYYGIYASGTSANEVWGNKFESIYMRYTTYKGIYISQAVYNTFEDIHITYVQDGASRAIDCWGNNNTFISIDVDSAIADYGQNNRWYNVTIEKARTENTENDAAFELRGYNISIYGITLENCSTTEGIATYDNTGEPKLYEIYNLKIWGSDYPTYWMSFHTGNVITVCGATIRSGVVPPIYARVRFINVYDRSRDKYYDNRGTATFSGDGSTTQFKIEHGLVRAPNRAKTKVWPLSQDAAGDFWIDVDDTYIYVNYKAAPPSGTDNVVLGWEAEV